MRSMIAVLLLVAAALPASPQELKPGFSIKLNAGLSVTLPFGAKTIDIEFAEGANCKIGSYGAAFKVTKVNHTMIYGQIVATTMFPHGSCPNWAQAAIPRELLLPLYRSQVKADDEEFFKKFRELAGSSLAASHEARR